VPSSPRPEALEARPGAPLRLAYAGVAAPVIVVGTLFLGFLFTPGFSPVDNTESELLGLGSPLRTSLGAALACGYLCLVVYAWDVHRLLPPVRPWARHAAIFLAATGVFGIALLLVPYDPVAYTDARRWAHRLVAAGLAVSALVAMAASALALSGDMRHRALAFYTWASLTAMVAFEISTGLAVYAGWPAPGLWENLSVLAFAQWQAVVTLQLVWGRR